MNLPALAVFDIDGTLVGYDGRCSAATKEALAKLRTAGTTVLVATGRPMALVPATVKQLGGADYASGGNGATVMDLASGEILRDLTIEASVAKQAIVALREQLPGVGFAIECRKRVIEEPGFNRRVPVSSHENAVSDVLEHWEAPTEAVRRLVIFHDDYDQNLDGLAAIISGFLPQEYEVQYGGLNLVEVACANDDKVEAVKMLAERLNIAQQDIAAVGDGRNDIEMIRWAGRGYAMANAHPLVIEAANHVAGSVEVDGVAKLVESWFSEAAASS